MKKMYRRISLKHNMDILDRKYDIIIQRTKLKKIKGNYFYNIMPTKCIFCNKTHAMYVYFNYKYKSYTIKCRAKECKHKAKRGSLE